MGAPSIPPEQLRALLEAAIREAPAFPSEESVSEEELRWLARAETLVEAGGTMAEQVEFRTARQALGSYSHNPNGLMSPLLNCYYRAELRAPPAAQGRFIPPGDTWGGYAALVNLVSRECDQLFIVDPYLDATLFTEVLPHAKARRAARCLTVKGASHAALQAAALKWSQEGAASVPVELRYAPKQALHDRLVFVDGEAWDVSQSLKDLARRSPASLARSDIEMGKLKLAHYNELWEQSAKVA